MISKRQEIGLFTNTELLRGTPTQDGGRHDGEAESRNYQSRITGTTEAAAYQYQPLELEGQGMHSQGISELKHPELEEVDPSSRLAVDPFDTESIMVSGFDATFTCDSIGIETTPDTEIFDTTSIMSANFDGFDEGLFNT